MSEGLREEIINREGFSFSFNPAACSSCSAKCCKGSSGNIWVTADDIYNICKFLGINPIDGVISFFEKRDNRYSIREQQLDDDYRCLFLNNINKCSIYAVRPLQCRTFPFWEHFKSDTEMLLQDCKGVIELYEVK